MRQAGLFGLSDQLKRLSDCGDPLETMSRVVDFEVFRPALRKALAYGDGAMGGRPSLRGLRMVPLDALLNRKQNVIATIGGLLAEHNVHCGLRELAHHRDAFSALD